MSSAASLSVIPSVSPRDGSSAGDVPAMTPDDVHASVTAARAAQPAWAALPIAERAAAMKRIHKRFLDRAERIVEVVTHETGKTDGEAWTVEVLSTGDLFPYWASHAAEHLQRERVSINPINYPGKTGFIEYVPRGVVGVISPWNFAVAIPFRGIIPALMAGNAVVFKPSSQTPRLGQLIAEIFQPELPEGLFQVIIGRGATGEAMIDAGIDFLAFTGSVGVGRTLAQKCAARFVPCALELGGNDPAIVLADCNLSRTVEGLVWGAFNNCGQNCASVERVYVERAIADAFIDAVVARVAKLERGRDYGPLTTAGQREIVVQQVDSARAAGANVRCGGEAESGDGYWYPPTVLTDVPDDADVVREETFGPVMPIRVVDDVEEAIRLANDAKYGLTASIWTGDLKRGAQLARRLDAGVVTVNNHGFTAAIPSAPWSGIKETGYGATNSHLALMEMVRPRFLLVDRSSRPEMWWYPYNQQLVTAAGALRDIARGQLGAVTRLVPAFLKRFSE